MTDDQELQRLKDAYTAAHRDADVAQKAYYVAVRNYRIEDIPAALATYQEQLRCRRAAYAAHRARQRTERES